MFNTCVKCGLYSVEKEIIPEGSFAIYPNCGQKQKFKQLPLFVITGASGVGKSTVCTNLMSISDDFIVIECDIFWNEQFNKPETDYKEFREHCMRVSKNVAQGGKPVVLCGSSTPAQYEACLERRYFSDVFYGAIVCSEDKITPRLKQRPEYRNCGSLEYINNHVRFNNWFIENQNKLNVPLKLIDNSDETIEETTYKLLSWMKEMLK